MTLEIQNLQQDLTAIGGLYSVDDIMLLTPWAIADEGPSDVRCPAAISSVRIARPAAARFSSRPLVAALQHFGLRCIHRSRQSRLITLRHL